MAMLKPTILLDDEGNEVQNVRTVSTYRGLSVEEAPGIISGGTNIMLDANMSPLSNLASPYLESKLADTFAQSSPAAKVPEPEPVKYTKPVYEPEQESPVSTFSEEPKQNTALKIAAAALTGTAAGVGIEKVLDLIKKKKEDKLAVENKLITKTPEEKLKDLSTYVGIAAAVFGLITFLTKK